MQNRMQKNYMAQGFWIVFMAAVMVGGPYAFWSKTNPQLTSRPDFQALDATLPDPSPETMAKIMPPGKILRQSEPEDTDIQQHPLSHFLSALHRVRTQQDKVRVAYFGDSMIEGDLITQSLRNHLQEIFGGEGVGFVPIYSQNPYFRKSIRHDVSSDWEDYNFMKPAKPEHGLGISGEYFITQRPQSTGRTWVRYRGAKLFDRTQTFEEVHLYYGHPQGESAVTPYVIAKSDQATDTLILNQKGLVNHVAIAQQPTQSVKLNFNLPDDMPVYGLSFESNHGVFLDNFAARGHSGMDLTEIPGDNLQAFHELLNYDLIVLHFGLNVVSTRRKNFDSYEKGMKKVVEHFQKHMPGADILLVSVSDKSSSVNGVLQTDPSVPLIVAAQERVATEKGVGFYNLFQGMGGRNSMIQWVKDDLARRDYAHPNRKGAKQMANILQKYFIESYETFNETTISEEQAYAITVTPKKEKGPLSMAE